MNKNGLAVIQSIFNNGEVKGNLKKIERIVRDSVIKFPNISIITFPELCTTGYFLEKSLSDVSEDKEGSIFQKISSIASKYDVYIVYGYVERDAENELYNSLQLVDPSGKSLANYRKIHLTPLEREYFKPGNELVVVDTEFAKIGLMICWDLAFPELARLLALEGAEVILAPSAWEEPFQKPFFNFGMARAIDNTVYLAASNHLGSSGSLQFFGGASIYGPDGEVLQRSIEANQEIVVTTIDLDRIKELKQTFFTMIDERRTDLY